MSAASHSYSSDSQHSIPPPPTALNDPSTSESARKHLQPSSSFLLSFSTPNLRQGKGKGVKQQHNSKRNSHFGELDRTAIPTSPDPLSDVRLTATGTAAERTEDDEDRYEWAVLYENQRGITVFSTPYYSSNILLPSDPPPFTVPTTSQRRSDQPEVSLEHYPLPDGNWRWISKSWMIDMRSDSGEVQHDGFEYNWGFRRHHWRAQIGALSSGGYVRRRRWVRLMMRPGNKTKQSEEHLESIASSNTTPIATSLSTSWVEQHRDRRMSMPVSVQSPSVATSFGERDESFIELWQGNIEEDWKMCRYMLRMAGRDGAKLELWRRWLDIGNDSGHGQDAESTAASSAPPIDFVKAMLRVHAKEIMEFFIFPESRARFVQALEQAAVYRDFQDGLGPGWSMSSRAGLAFWSLNSGMDLGRAKEPEGTDAPKAS